MALADSDVVDVASHAAVTASNVVDKLGSIVDAIPSTVYGSEDLFMYVSSNIYRAYTRALGGFGANGLGAAGYNSQGNNQDLSTGLQYDGVQLFLGRGLNDNTAMAAQNLTYTLVQGYYQITMK